MSKRSRPLLGTLVEIAIAAPAWDKDHAFDAAFSAIAAVERQMSFHDPDSDLSRLNRCAHETPQRVHPWMWRVLSEASRLYEKSAAVFDPSVAPKLVEAGLLPQPRDMRKPQQNASFSDVALLSGGHVFFKRPLWLDLGGIAKGFAVDVAVLALRARGIRQACVNAGGDLRVFGSEPQTIHLRNPNNPTTYLEIGQLANGACATSGGYFGEDHTDLWAIFDPRGIRLKRSGSVTIIAPRCILADALTKVATLAPASKVKPLLGLFKAQAIAT